MRTIIDLPEDQLAALRALEQQRKLSRAALVREAVAEYVAKRLEAVDAFGAWKPAKVKVDALAHQRKLRAEWDRGGTAMDRAGKARA